MTQLPEHRARKRFGQNFLRDPGIIDRIQRSIAARPGQHLVEIGPGQGALTEGLLSSGAELTAIELDRDLAGWLRQRWADCGRFALVESDALKVDFRQLQRAGEPLRVVGNLPYNISTPLLFHLFDYLDIIADMHFMLQWEVVERMAARPNTADYGRLSVMTQYHCQVQRLFAVPPESFDPRPKVMSAIVRLAPHAERPWRADDEAMLERVVREAFGQRRKTLRNALRQLAGDGLLESLGIDPGRRPETLSVAEFVAIANAVAARPGA